MRPRLLKRQRQPRRRRLQTSRHRILEARHFRRNNEAVRTIMTDKKAIRRLATLGLLAVLVGGCSAISALNPLNKKEDIMPGERTAALPQGPTDVTGGTPAIGAAEAVADWSQPGGNAANAPGNVSMGSVTGSAGWRVRAVDKASKRNIRPSVPPIVHGGVIYVYDTDGHVNALRAGGGRSWSVSLAPEGERSHAAGGGVAASGSAVFVATGFGELVALDAATGSKIWSHELGAPAYSAPTAAGGLVFVVSATNVLFAINQSDGSEAWQYPGIPETAGVLSAASPAVSGNTVVVPYSSGEVIAFDAATGKLKWADAVVRSTRTLAVSGLNDVAASPVIYGGVVYATGVSGRTIAVSLESGERLWEQNIGSASTPAVSGNALFLIDLSDNLIAVDRASGSVFWQTALPVIRKKKFFSVWAGPTLAGGMLWSVSNDRKLVAVDPASGQIVVDKQLSSAAYIKPTAAGGQLLVLSSDGTLTAYN
jgi:outer membrane protein assembly factor BamB